MDTAFGIDPHVLLREHGVGIGRQRRARQDLPGGARRDGGSGVLPSRDAAGDARASRRSIRVGRAHGVSVDGGIVERQQVDWDDVLGPDAADVGVQCHGLHGSHGPHVGGDHAQRLDQRQERAAECETPI